MGKQRRIRQKLHTSLSTSKEVEHISINLNVSDTNLNNTWPLLKMDTNIFANVNIDFDELKKDLSDNVKRVQSLKTTKCNENNNNTDKAVKKKDRLKIRKEILLRKIDTINQLRKELKQKDKKKKNNKEMKTDIRSDVKSLALPMVQTINKKKSFKSKVKGIESEYKRQKDANKSIKSLKKNLSSKFENNHLETIRNLVDQYVNNL